MADRSRIIRLNIGGKVFETRLETLQKYPDTMLGRMYNSQMKVEEIPFFDRSSKLFDSILNFYRTAIISKPHDVPQNIWIEELRYWGLPEDDQKEPSLTSQLAELITLIKEGKLQSPPGPMGINEPVGLMPNIGYAVHWPIHNKRGQ